jgi:dihydrofolate reductase
MLIKSRMGISADGFVATPDGMPAFLSMPGFVPGQSHGYPSFIEHCDAVLMGRNTFLPALGAPSWPWPGLQTFVLTSQPLPPETPPDVVVISGGPAEAVERLRARGSGGDVHLVGGPRTIEGLAAIGALDRLELVVLPVMLGEGVRLSQPGVPKRPLTLVRSPETYPDGSVELVYRPGCENGENA